MIAGKDFPSAFGADNFTSRRTTGHNLYDPESLISEAEAARGMTYENSRRNWPGTEIYRRATEGLLSIEAILQLAPRVRIDNRLERIKQEFGGGNPHV